MARDPMELRRRLRALKPVPWFAWEARPNAGMIGQLELPWPYLQPSGDDRPDARWGALWLIQSLDFRKANAFLDERREEMRRQTGWMPEFHTRDRSLGSMFCVWFEMFGRGGPYHWIFTPPIYRFCDLNKEFPYLSEPNNGVLSPPFDFWVQPDVFLETGEVLQGSPIYNGQVLDYELLVARPRNLHELAKDRQGHGRALELIDFVQVALDAWLERYERTGETTPDPRFAFTWAEQRVEKERQRFDHCNWKQAAFDAVLEPEPDDCDDETAYRYKLRSMQSWAGALCVRHARDLIDHEPGIYDFEAIS